MQNGDLGVSEAGLGRLADDLDDMQRYLDQQVRRMDAVVDKIAAGWQGPTATAYRALHRGVAEDAVRIRKVVALLEAATRASRDGFTEQELEVLASFRRSQEGQDVSAAARALSVPDQAPPADPVRATSRLQDI
ncbi:WXG100 family type VII secretion target [Streptomyces sp. NPDC058401]|uniref:WXG100 family type VII secretion target n=1 Tax=Streptomyces sp. NPDC058401 TaxID=3346480 RepID=UPI003660166F